MRQSETLAWLQFASSCAGILAVMCAFWIGASYFEARAYNRVTGESVSTVDAMFLQLRVEAGPGRIDSQER